MAKIEFKRVVIEVKEKKSPVPAVDVLVDGESVGALLMPDFAHVIASVSNRPMSPDLISDALHGLMRDR